MRVECQPYIRQQIVYDLVEVELLYFVVYSKHSVIDPHHLFHPHTLTGNEMPDSTLYWQLMTGMAPSDDSESSSTTYGHAMMMMPDSSPVMAVDDWNGSQ